MSSGYAILSKVVPCPLPFWFGNACGPWKYSETWAPPESLVRLISGDLGLQWLGFPAGGWGWVAAVKAPGPSH